MAAGLAVIASDTSANAHIVRTTGAGEVFRAGDAAALAYAIECVADPERCDAAGRAAQRAILDRYHWEQDSAAFARSVSLVARVRHRPAARALPLPST
jgi:glycosyltransferase involved in cell wall biosynthesis